MQNSPFASFSSVIVPRYTVSTGFTPPDFLIHISCLIKKLGEKATLLVLLIMMLFSLGFSPLTKAQNNSCNADSACASWSGWFIQSDSVLIGINGDTCYITFGYQWRICTGTPTKMQIVSKQFTFPDSSCGFGPYLDSLNNANSSLLWSIIDNIYGQADRRLGELRYLKYRLANPPTSQFDCLNSVGCASTSGFFETVTYYSECRDYINVGAPGGGVSPGCPGISYVVNCSSQDCCILSRMMCYDNGAVRVCETSSPGGGTSNCTGNGTFTAPVGCSINFRSGCRSVSCP